MSLVSNMKIYYQRKYRPKGMIDSVIVEDEEHLVSQLNVIEKSTSDVLTRCYLPYDANYPNYGLNGFTGIYRTWHSSEECSYKPGYIYLDEHYYTWKDFFTDYDIQVFQNWVSNDGNGYSISWKKINSLQSSNTKNASKFYIINQPLATFWVSENENKQLVAIGQVSVLPFNKQNFIIKKANVRFDIVLYSFSSDVDISTLYSKELKYSSYILSELHIVENGVDRVLKYNEDYDATAILCNYENLSYTSNGIADTYYTHSQNKIRFQQWIDDFKKVKYYPMFSMNANPLTTYNYDNITYYTTNTQTPTTSRWNGFMFLADVSDVSIYPTNGFGYQNGSVFQDYLLRYDDELGQESNNPNHTKDPNDSDPGHGPSGSSGDNGGNGDHDNTSDKILPPGIPTLSGSGVGLFTIFNPNTGQLAELGKKLWNPTALQAIKQYFSSPMETILGLGIIPVQPRQGSAKNILLGVYDTEISCTTVSSDYVIKDCGSISINRYYGSYLDYDPYTRISLYLPYIGEIQIDPDEVMQSVLGVQYYVNVVTGDCVAIVTSDGSIVYTAAGNCIRQLPIGQADYSNIINTAVSAVSTIATAVAGGTAASSVGNAVAGAAKTEAGKKVAEARASSQLVQEGVGAGTSLINQVMQSKMRYNHAGSIGVGSGQLSYQKPYLTIERPNLDLADNYKSFVGYPCNKTMQLSHCSGFTQIESCKLSVSGATDGELTEILAFLTEGVII